MRYEYKCLECGKSFEEDLPVKDRHYPCELPCSFCGGHVQKLIGNKGGFKLLGYGWEKDSYATYYGDTPEFKERFGSD